MCRNLIGKRLPNRNIVQSSSLLAKVCKVESGQNSSLLRIHKPKCNIHLQYIFCSTKFVHKIKNKTGKQYISGYIDYVKAFENESHSQYQQWHFLLHKALGRMTFCSAMWHIIFRSSDIAITMKKQVGIIQIDTYVKLLSYKLSVTWSNLWALLSVYPWTQNMYANWNP